MIEYLRDPERIHEHNMALLQAQTDLSAFTPEQQRVVAQMVLAYGDPDLVKHIRFSDNAVNVARKAIKQRSNLLYDVELVKHALNKSLLYQEPLGFMGRASVISQAKNTKQTLAMTAVDCWKPYLSGGIVLIGQSATALLRLIEILQEGVRPPALIIASPRGFVNATEAKKLLWKQHQELGVECIVVDGTRGGGVLAAAALNALLMP